MTATLTTAGEVLEDEQDAEFRLSARQSDLLRTLNTLFDELSPARLEEDFFDITESPLEACDVSRLARD